MFVKFRYPLHVLYTDPHEGIHSDFYYIPQGVFCLSIKLCALAPTNSSFHSNYPFFMAGGI